MADHEIEWFIPPRQKDSVEDIVSHLRETRRAVSRKADSMGRDAQLELLRHHDTGAAGIRVEGSPPHLLDCYVILEDADPGGEGKAGKNRFDRSAMSIEFGWRKKDGTTKVGLHVLGKAMGRAIQRYTGPR